MAEIYTIIAIVAFSFAGACLILSIVFWLRFDILKIINDFSGRTERRSIAQMGERSREKPRRVLAASQGKGKITDRLSLKELSGKKEKVQQAQETALLPDSGFDVATTVLDQEEGTQLLQDTAVDATTLLGEEAEGTILLNSKNLLQQDSVKETVGQTDELTAGNVKFTIIEDILMIHTEEVV